MKLINIGKLDKKEVCIILILFLISFNVIFVLYPYTLLSTINSPNTKLEISLLDINSTNASFNSSFFITNPNDFTITLKNIEINTFLDNGQSISKVFIDKKQISPKNDISFFENIDIDFLGKNSEMLRIVATGEIGMNLGFLETNIPLTLTVNTDIMNFIDDIKAPQINTHLQYGEINQNNVSLLLQLDIHNPNSFDINIHNISVTLVSEKGNEVGFINFSNMYLSAQNTSQISSNGIICLDALNAQYLYVNTSMNMKITIAGFVKESSFTITSKVDMPDLNTLLSTSFPTDVIIRGDYHPTWKGMIDSITLEVKNPNNVEYSVKDIQVHIYRIDRNKKTLIANGTIEEGLITANASTKLKGEVLIPYKKFFIPPEGSKILPDWLKVSIRANGTIKGLQSYMWVGMVAYQDVNPLRKETIKLGDTRVWYE